MPIEIRELSSIDAINQFEPEWLRFEKNNFNPSQQFHLIKKYLEIFLNKEHNRVGYNKRILVLLVYENTQLQFIMPLFIVHRRLIRFISYVAIENLMNACLMPYQKYIGKAKPEYFQAIKTWLKQKCKYDILWFAYLDEEYLDKFQGGSNLLYGLCPIIELDQFKDYREFNRKRYKKDIRYNIQSRKSKFEKAGGSFIKTEYGKITEQEFNEIRRVSATKTVDNKRDPMSDEARVDFLKESLKRLPNQIVLAKLEDKIVGYHISFFASDGVRIFASLSYDRNYRSFGIGNLIDDYEIRTENFNSTKVINMGTGIDSYKLKFSTGYEKLFLHMDGGNTLCSRLIYYWIKKRQKKVEMNLEKHLAI